MNFWTGSLLRVNNPPPSRRKQGGAKFTTLRAYFGVLRFFALLFEKTRFEKSLHSFSQLKYKDYLEMNWTKVQSLEM